MTTMSPVKVSLISTASGWLAACCIYIIHDVFRSVFWPQPPHDALDWIVTDLVIFVVAAPLAIIVWLPLWSAYAFAPVSSAFWHISLWVVCGWAIGCGLVYVFSPLFESSLPMSPFNYASCAGAI